MSWTGALFTLCPLAQDWLQKTAEEIQEFGVDEALCQCLLLELLVCVASLQVRDWVKAVLKAKRLDEGKAAAAAQRLEDEEVTGAMLFGFTADKLLDYGVKRGPADTHTVNLLIVLSCSGFEFVAGISSHFPKTFLDHFVGNVHTDIHDSSVILLRLQANVHVYSVSCCAFAFEQHSWLGKPAKFVLGLSTGL